MSQENHQENQKKLIRKHLKRYHFTQTKKHSKHFKSLFDFPGFFQIKKQRGPFDLKTKKRCSGFVHSKDLRELACISESVSATTTKGFQSNFDDLRNYDIFALFLEKEDFFVPALTLWRWWTLKQCVAFGQTTHLAAILPHSSLSLDDFVTLDGRPGARLMH